MFLEEEKNANKNRQRGGLFFSECTPFNNVTIDIWKEALLFAVGNAFTLSLIATIISAMLFNMNAIDKNAATLLISYSVLFALLITLVFKYIPKFLPKFANWTPYVVGVGIGLSVILFDELYLRFVNLFYNTGISGNESSIREVIARYPVASIFIFGLIGPMCEELTYRVGVFNLIKRWKRVVAYIVAGLLFGFIHMDFKGNIATEFILLPTYVAPGLLLSFAYDLFDLPCSYTAHITNNLIVIISQVVKLNS